VNEHHQHEWTPTDTPGTFACTQCPATATQCGSCTRILTTRGRTCDDCVSKARNDVRAIRDLYRTLPDIIAAAAGLHAIRYDQRGTGKPTRATDTTIIGGAAFVLAGPGSSPDSGLQLGRGETTETIAYLAAAEQHDPPSVLGVLTGWEDEWRTEAGHTAADTTSVDAAVEYLLAHTTWAAQHSGRWAEHRTAIRGLLFRLRVVTGTDDRPVKAGVPCPYCGGAVVQHWQKHDPKTPGSGGLDDTRVCDRCATAFPSEAHFLLAIRHAHQSLPTTCPEQLVTIDDAKRIYKGRVAPKAFDKWVERGTLPQAVGADGRPAHDVRGRPLYRLATIDLQATTAS